MLPQRRAAFEESSSLVSRCSCVALALTSLGTRQSHSPVFGAGKVSGLQVTSGLLAYLHTGMQRLFPTALPLFLSPSA